MTENLSEEFRSVPHDSESFGSFPNPSASFRNVPNHSEPFRIVPNGAERKENHTLTVREASRMFEAAGVARTERSIVNWCQPNKNGVARLDAYYDSNERKYCLTRRSIDLAIEEEKAKAARVNSERSEPFRTDSTVFGNVQIKSTEERSGSENEMKKVQALEQEVMDLKIVNRSKDYFLERLKSERDEAVTKLIEFSHKIGELETKLLQLAPPVQNPRRLIIQKDSGTLTEHYQSSNDHAR